MFTHEVAKRWIKKGHEVTLFTSEFDGCKHEEILDGITILRSGGRFSVYMQAQKFYKKIFKHMDFDVVIDEINTVPFFTPRFVHNEKVVALIHQLAREYWFYEMPFPLSYLGYYYLEKHWLSNYLNIPAVTVSDSSKADLHDLNFRQIFLVPEGLNFSPLKFIPERNVDPIIVFSGRLKRAKRPDHVIKAFKIVKTRLPKTQLWLFGDGPFRKELASLACKDVTFFGNIPNFQRRDLLQKCWLLVNPSVREGWGLNIVEANAMGIPTVAYDVPGLRDSVKHGKTGLLAEAGNVEDLAAKIIMLLSNRSLRDAMSENSLAFAREFDWNITAKKFEEVLEQVVAQ